ncbi:hypothetical protein IFM89_004786 [Coptis chinensis]|uniref:Transmembrane protein n=1 Tax=Coptis chinensis TaxID=261450 RepID=A0A835LYH5_9MAGN|nr:hypothetical protein IFM89_004786 [Coptis chinensis]
MYNCKMMNKSVMLVLLAFVLVILVQMAGAVRQHAANDLLHPQVAIGASPPINPNPWRLSFTMKRYQFLFLYNGFTNRALLRMRMNMEPLIQTRPAEKLVLAASGKGKVFYSAPKYVATKAPISENEEEN